MPAKFRVELTQGAERDLEALHDYLAAHRSADEANALLEGPLIKIETLETFRSAATTPRNLRRWASANSVKRPCRPIASFTGSRARLCSS